MTSSYKSHNFCVRCLIKYPKSTTKCSQCGNKIRTTARKPWANKIKLKFLCSSCGHTYGECACICCRADEEDPE